MLLDFVSIAGGAYFALTLFAQLDLIDTVADLPACLMTCDFILWVNCLFLEQAVLDVLDIVSLFHGAATVLQKMRPICVACCLGSQIGCFYLNNHRLDISLALLSMNFVV